MKVRSNLVAEELLDLRPATGQVETSGLRVAAVLQLDKEASSLLLGFAASISLPIEDLLLGGYAALLFRLTAQEQISIVPLGAGGEHGAVNRTGPPAVVESPTVVENNDQPATSFDFGEQASLRDAMVSRTFSPAAAPHLYYYYFGETPFAAGEADAELVLQISRAPSGSGERIALTLSSPSAARQAHTLENWLLYYRHLLHDAMLNPSTPVSQLAMLDSATLETIYARLNDTAVPYARARLIHHRFAERAAIAPERIAVISGNRRLTYAELDRQSDQLAATLIAMGAGADRCIAICLERSVWMAVALLGVMKSGSCYVPLDPLHPPDRLAGILAECAPIAVISETRIAHLVSGSGFPVLHIDSPAPLPDAAVQHAVATAESLAYIIFTSGTTGKPKGVSITHGGLANLLEAMEIVPGINASDRLLALATISFDMAVIDIFRPLAAGATVVIAEQSAVADPFAIAQLIREHDITCMLATPATWKMLIHSGWAGKRDLQAMTGGEALPRDLANSLVGRAGQLWNCYGPTETTVCSSVLRLRHGSGVVPIGGPIANTTFHVMDPAGRPVPPGVQGELYIGGDGVGRGYFQRPELTARHFVPDRFSAPHPGSRVSRCDAARVFRTGDLVRLLEDGNLEFFGRIDHQVKLRGFRIELGEIEAVLRAHPAVADAVVLLRNDAGYEPRLVAYVVARRAPENVDSPEMADLREHCARLLPGYMLPAAFARLEQLPLTTSGKVDRKALPAPESLSPSSQPSPQPSSRSETPRDEMETRLLNIFRDVLRHKTMGVTDSFFDYGGYSLLSIELFSRINKAFSQSLPISLLFDAPTVRALAQVISSGIQPPAIVPIRPRGVGVPLFIIHSYLLYAALPQIVEASSPIYGIRESAGDRSLHSVQHRAELYVSEILKVAFAGPVHLMGWCAAASLTVEVARQLQGRGHVVEMVALLDAERPGFDIRDAGGDVSRLSRLRTAWAFHRQRISELPPGHGWGYVADLLKRHFNTSIETFFIRHFSRVLWLERHFRNVLPAFVFDNTSANTAALQDYGIKPFQGSLTLFRAADVPHLASKDETMGWGEVALEGVDVVFVPGDHESMFRKPQLDSFGQKLREAMAGHRSRLVQR